MTVLLDANILVRSADPADPQRGVAVAAVSTLKMRGEVLQVVPQSLYEFWVVASRPRSRNGLGLSVDECISEIKLIKLYYPMLPDPPTIYGEWEALVVKHACQGKVAHDARYVAAMNLHGLTHILTFNTADFARFPGITALDPASVATAPGIP